MPFKSEAQRRFMHSNHPAIAERWETETPQDAKLPEHVPGAKAKKPKPRPKGYDELMAYLAGKR
jgi:hypothetical protein